MKKLLEYKRDFMSTTIEIKLIKSDQPTIKTSEVVEEAFGEFDRIVKSYTRFNENSELSNLNRNAGKWTKVSSEFINLIEYMLQVAEKSNGAFDPTIVDFLEMYGYSNKTNFEEKLSDPKLLENIQAFAKKRPHWKEIKVNKSEGTVYLAENQRIDLGGVGKGYAIDCAFNKLESIFDNFIINAGGDIRVKGRELNSKKWRVSLHSKKDTSNMNESLKNSFMKSENLGQIELENEAIASSGSWARKVNSFHHLLNPHTGMPHDASYTTAFVVAPTALEADAWATALFVGGESVIKVTPFKYLLK